MVNVKEESFVFFKVLLGDFKNKLILSEKFAALSGKWPELKLSTALGDNNDDDKNKKVWRVEIQYFGGTFNLTGDGWRSFVKDHDLRFGYFLVFLHCSDVNFYVVPFDLTGFRIAYAQITTINHLKSKEIMDVDDYDDKLKKQKIEKNPNLAGTPEMEQNKNKMVNEDHLKVANRPQFKIIVQPTYIERSEIHFPNLFRVANNLAKTTEANLTTAIGSWTVKFRHTHNRKRMIKRSAFSLGTFDFLRANNLKQGDVCIFELLSKDENRASFLVTKEDNDLEKRSLSEVANVGVATSTRSDTQASRRFTSTDQVPIQTYQRRNRQINGCNTT